MGKRTKEELELQQLYADMGNYVYKKTKDAGVPITLGDQAKRLNLTQNAYSGYRNDNRYVVTQGLIDQFREVFYEDLEGFDQPSPEAEELEQLRQDYEQLRQLLEEKEGKVDELLKANERLVIKYSAFLEKLLDPEKAQEMLRETKEQEEQTNEE